MSELGPDEDGGGSSPPGSEPVPGTGRVEMVSSGQDNPVAPLSLTGAVGVLAPVVIALLISVFFVTLFLLAFRSPAPHELRVGISGSAAPMRQLEQAVAAHAPGALDLHEYPSENAVQGAVEHRDVYAALAIQRDQWTLLVAGANGAVLIPALQRQFEPAAHEAGAPDSWCATWCLEHQVTHQD